MEQLYIILICVLVAAGLLLLVVLKPDLAKKYWGYIAAGVAVVAGLVFAVSQRKRPAAPDPEMQKKEQILQEDLKEVHEEAELVIREAQTREAEIHAEVEEIQQIDDKEERLKRLSDLFNRTRRPR